MNRFKADRLVTAETSSDDGRRQVVRLTSQGRAVFQDLDRRSATAFTAMLNDLTEEDQRRLVTAMETIQGIFAIAPQGEPYVIRPLRPGDLGWVVHRHGVLYAEEYGWDETFEALVARIVADYVEHHDARRDNAWIAEVGGEPAGYVFCVKKDNEVAQLRILLVEPNARGLGIGTRLVDECIRFAKRAGYQRIMLWTNDVLISARRIYEVAGFKLLEEESHYSFGDDLIGQNWELDLADAKV